MSVVSDRVWAIAGRAYEPCSYVTGQSSLKALAYEPTSYLTQMAAPPSRRNQMPEGTVVFGSAPRVQAPASPELRSFDPFGQD